jgi:enediyne biosynthesis protein E4
MKIWRIAALCLAIWGVNTYLATIFAAGQAEQPLPASKLDRNRMEEIENRSEAVTNDLLGLSAALRAGNFKDVPKYFAAGALITPLPAEAAKTETEVKWIERHGWQPGEARKMSGEEITKMWSDFLSHFSEVEDIRFKVAEGSFSESEPTGRVELAFALVGREKSNKREWVRGSLKAGVKQQGNRWVIEELKVAKLESLLASKDIFEEVSEAAGVALVAPKNSPIDHATGSHDLWHGAAAADLNNDGYIDLCVTAKNENFLYINEGNGKFRDIAGEAGIKVTPNAASPLFVDIDNDGDLDIFLATFGKQMLFLNEQKESGKLTFRDISQEAGVALDAYAYSPCTGDVNNDGLPDIYVASYNFINPQAMPGSWTNSLNGTPNLLFINEGKGKFREAAKSLGVDDPRWGFTGEFIDYDLDGDQDLFVVNDFGQSGFYLNELKETGKVKFRDITEKTGLKGGGFNAMGITFGDYNNDGLLDIHIPFISSIESDRLIKLVGEVEGIERMRELAGNRLYENKGDGSFKDVTEAVGWLPAGWAWGGTFIDFDNDGWQDIYSQNGYLSLKERKDILSIQWRAMMIGVNYEALAVGGTLADGERRDGFLRMFQYMFIKNHSLAGYDRDFLSLNLMGNGKKRFFDISGVSGIDSDTDGRGAVYADFDNDGDLDIFLTNMQKTPHLLFKNNIGQEGNWLRVTLKGNKSGNDAFGAIVKVKSALGLQTKVKAGGEGFMSQHDPRLLFGLGGDKKVESIEVIWPSGAKQTFDNFEAGQSLLITEGQQKAQLVTERRAALPAAKRPTSSQKPSGQ